MVRVQAGQREKRLDRVEPAHLVLGGLDLAPLGKVANIVIRPFFAANEIPVQGDNNLGRLQFVIGAHRPAKNGGSRRRPGRKIHGLVNKPPRLGIFLTDEGDQPLAGGTAALLQQKRQTFSLPFGARTATADRKSSASSRLALTLGAGEPHGPVRIVKVQNRSLGESVRAPSLSGCSEFPSILTGRPSCERTTNGTAPDRVGREVAKYLETPWT